MKLLGRINKETGYVMASIAHHDFRDEYGMMVDGGQPHCQDYAGYTRFNGKTEWFEVPQSFNELFDDYQTNTGKRKYGVWELKDVRILSEKEYPDVDSDEVLFENMCWGTRGKNGDEPLQYKLLKDLELDHLEAILRTQYNLSDVMVRAIEYWIGFKGWEEKHNTLI